jgi:hypothetical protein
MCNIVSTFASGEESRISWQTDPPNPFHLDFSLAMNKVQATVFVSERCPCYNLLCRSLLCSSEHHSRCKTSLWLRTKCRQLSFSLNTGHTTTYFAGLFCASLSINLDANHWANVLIKASFVLDCELGKTVVLMNSDPYGKHVTLHQGIAPR